MVVAVWSTTWTAGDGDTVGAVNTAGEARGIAAPPGAESRASWSISNPVVWPALDRRVWMPGPRVSPPASGPHKETVSGWRANAALVEPVTDTHTGAPSTVIRSSRHEDGMVAGTGGARSPGIPTSAMPRGMPIGALE